MSYCPVCLSVCLSLSLAPVHSQAEDDRNFEFVKQIKTQHEDHLFQLGTVYAVGIGKEGNRFVIDVYADPAVKSRLPTSMAGVMIRFNESGPFFAQQCTEQRGCDNRADSSSPIPIGVSTGNASTTGTMGFRGSVPNVEFPLPRKYGYITANHVAAGPCPNQKPIGEDQYQSGPADGLGNYIGDLDAFVPVEFGRFSSNEVDAAFVRKLTSVTIGDQICSLGTRTTTPVGASINMVVLKSGRTTYITRGRVKNVDFTVTVRYFPCLREARFFGQLAVEHEDCNCAFSEPGDSGAPVVDLGYNPVGMIIAGKSGNCISPAQSVVTPIGKILTALNFTLN